MARAFQVSLAIALSLHAGVALSLSAPPPAALASGASPAEPPLLGEIFEISEPSEPPGSHPQAPPPAEAPDQARPRRPLAPQAPAAASIAAPASAASAEVGPPSDAPSPFEGEGREGRGRRAVAGLFQGSPWLLGPAGAEAPAQPRGPLGPRAEDPGKGGKLLRESMEQADHSRGLGFGGPVASAAYAAGLGKGAPVQGGATFDVRLDASGALVAISARDTSGGDWATVLASLQAALAGKRLRVPSGTSGAVVSVRIEARHQLPSGKAPGDAVDIGQKGIGIGGTFDLADLSGHVSRVVSTRIISERTLR